MERSWWWKAALYGAHHRHGGALPRSHGGSRGEAARFIKDHFQKRIQLGLDLQGGLHLVYEVNVDKAVSDKVDRLSSEIEDRLRSDKGVNDVNWSRRREKAGHFDIVLTFKNPADQARSTTPLLREYRKSLDIAISRDAATGVVRLRLDPDQVDEVRDYALRQGIETIRNRVDKLGVSEPTIIKKGTDIIVELPGLKPADFERIKNDHRPDRAARVQDRRRRLDEYMKKVAAAVPSATEGAAGPPTSTFSPRRGPRRTRASAHEDVYLRSKSRDALSKFFAGADRRSRGPARSRDRLRGDAGARRGRRADARQVWRTYYLHKRAGADRRVPAPTPTRPGTSRPAAPRSRTSSTARAPRSPSG